MASARKHPGQRVLHPRWVAPVIEAPRQPFADAEPSFVSASSRTPASEDSRPPSKPISACLALRERGPFTATSHRETGTINPSTRQLRAETDREPLSGLVERVTFHNPDTGFCVLRVKVRGHRDLVAVLGSAADVRPGEFIQASGRWESHRDHGLQFKATFLKVTPPTTLEGIERYLGSGMIKGIGPKFAKRLIQAFGEQVFDVVEQQPDRLTTVAGIGSVRAKRITAGWADQRVIREIMTFLQSHGVGTSRAVRIFKTYGADAIAVVSENPYRLARDIRGIGFLTADAIAQKLGIEKIAMIRARAGISYALNEAISEGHCALPRDDLLALAEKLLGIPSEIVTDALELELRDQVIVADTIGEQQCVFLAHLWHAERQIADRVRRLVASEPSWPPIDAERAITWVEGKLGVTLAPSQRDAIAVALRSNAIVITGGPGVGKTTLMKSILTILRAKSVSVALCAPTGRAAKRLSESTGLDAKTIHRLLEVDPKRGGFSRNDDNPLACDLLVVDETSMVDVPLMASLMKALPRAAALMLVGDVDQLPSVGPGQVLADIIESGTVPVARLTEVFRQAAESLIIRNAHRINRGEMPELPKAGGDASDFYFVDAADPEEGVQKVIEVVRNRVPRRFGLDPTRDIQVLCPMNRGGIGARALNLALQQALNPPGDKPMVERFGFTYRPGDKVMQTENDYEKEVYNGDLGMVEGIDPDAQEITISFDGRVVVYQFGELDEVSLAYATSIHKAQGSEYPAVVLPVMTQHYPMLKRNLIYTGITRGKRLVVLIGQRKALAIAVHGKRIERRWSKLGEWMM